MISNIYLGRKYSDSSSSISGTTTLLAYVILWLIYLKNVYIEPSWPLKRSDIDFADLLLIKDSLQKMTLIMKCYACNFVYFVTKAGHNGGVVDLGTKFFRNFGF